MVFLLSFHGEIYGGHLVMAPLNIHAEESVAPKRKKNKTLKILLGIAALVAVPAIGTTLAQTITINSNGAVQFGQGAITTAACDTGLNLSTTSVYSNDFYVKTITISDIDLTSGCEGKTLTISAAIPAASPSPSVEGELSSGVTQISFSIPSSTGPTSTQVTNLTSGVTATAGLVSNAGSPYKSDATAVPYDDTGKITLTIGTPTFLSSNVAKFLIQSS
jgi:hypothetical protein